MKYFLVLFALTGFTNAGVIRQDAAEITSLEPSSLKEDWRDFLSILPLEDLRDIILLYLEDAEVQNVLAFVLSPRFVNIVEDMEAIPEIKMMEHFLEESGLPVRHFMTSFKEILSIGSERSMRVIRLGGFRGLMDNIRDRINWDDMKKLYKSKMETSHKFKKLIKRIGSRELKKLIDSLTSNKKVKDISMELTNAGLDVVGITRSVLHFFGLGGRRM